MLYRIFTEDIPENHEAIEEVISKKYEGFTLFKGEGFWRLQKENSLVIEIITEEQDTIINDLARQIKDIGKQEAVLVQKIRNKQWLV